MKLADIYNAPVQGIEGNIPLVNEQDAPPVIRNFVAKHARSVNKAGPMKDKKNDYKRKPKHKKKDVAEGND